MVWFTIAVVLVLVVVCYTIGTEKQTVFSLPTNIIKMNSAFFWSIILLVIHHAVTNLLGFEKFIGMGPRVASDFEYGGL